MPYYGIDWKGELDSINLKKLVRDVCRTILANIRQCLQQLPCSRSTYFVMRSSVTRATNRSIVGYWCWRNRLHADSQCQSTSCESKLKRGRRTHQCKALHLSLLHNFSALLSVCPYITRQLLCKSDN